MPAVYLVATPIGNLEDITLRAIRILKEVDVVLCEDTRTTGVLFERYNITTKRIPYNDENAKKMESAVRSLLEEGKSLALVSDAGTPGVSDPGRSLLSLVRTAFPKIPITAIPGASALTTALSLSGWSGAVTYVGFLPHKKGRHTALCAIQARSEATLLFESPHRIEKALKELKDILPERRLWVFRELTKKFETVLSGTPDELLQHYAQHPDQVRGEFVVLVEGE